MRVEIADTPEAREKGLMFRTDLPKDHGMLFLFENDAYRTFWMKNTPLPLDIIFIGREGKVAEIAQDTEPFSLRLIQSRAPCRAVLEVNAGFAERHGITAGDRVVYRGIDSPLLRR